MERRSAPFSSTAADELLFFGHGADLLMGDDEQVSAEERIKSYLGEPSDRGVPARRRVIRRPLGGGGYQAQTIVFSERDRDAVGLSGSEPLSELLQQLGSSRSKGAPSAAGVPQLHSGLAAGLAAAADDSERRKQRAGGGRATTVSPEQQMRACFVQELMLAALSQPVAELDGGPLDAAFPER